MKQGSVSDAKRRQCACLLTLLHNCGTYRVLEQLRVLQALSKQGAIRQVLDARVWRAAVVEADRIADERAKLSTALLGHTPGHCHGSL
jgi:hypothetical protein